MRKIVSCDRCDRTMRAPITSRVHYHKCDAAEPHHPWVRPKPQEIPRSKFEMAVDELELDLEEWQEAYGG